jgi:hypothetical protein
MTFPQFAVSLWIGHSITVSGRHYANAVPDELFDRAAVFATPKTKRALQNALQHAAAPPCTAMKSPTSDDSKNAETREEFVSLQVSAPSCNNEEQWSRGESNTRAYPVRTKENRLFGNTDEKRAAKCAADSNLLGDPALLMLNRGWNALPPAVRDAIAVLAQHAANEPSMPVNLARRRKRQREAGRSPRASG